MKQILGTIASPGGNQMFFCSMVNRLRSGELLTGAPTVTTPDSGITISSIAVNTSKLVSGTVVSEISEAVQWRVNATGTVTGTKIVSFDITYSTDQANTDKVTVSLSLKTSVEV